MSKLLILTVLVPMWHQNYQGSSPAKDGSGYICKVKAIFSSHMGYLIWKRYLTRQRQLKATSILCSVKYQFINELLILMIRHVFSTQTVRYTPNFKYKKWKLALNSCFSDMATDYWLLTFQMNVVLYCEIRFVLINQNLIY